MENGDVEEVVNIYRGGFASSWYRAAVALFIEALRVQTNADKQQTKNRE
jgi:hypothetical protein